MSEKMERITLYATIGISVILSVLDFVGILDKTPLKKRVDEFHQNCTLLKRRVL
jgi:hypothetical protein